MLKRIFASMRNRPLEVLQAYSHSSSDELLLSNIARQASPRLPKTFTVQHAHELRLALTQAKQHDTIVIVKSGTYGEINIHHKQHLTIRSAHPNILIEGYIILSGETRYIQLEHLNLWHGQGNPQNHALIFSQFQTQHILIRRCHFASLPYFQPNHDPNLSIQRPHWIDALHLQGISHHVMSCQFNHLRYAIVLLAKHGNIHRNTFRHFSQHAIWVANDHICITRNHFLLTKTLAQPVKQAMLVAPFTKRTHPVILCNLHISHNSFSEYMSEPNLSAAPSPLPETIQIRDCQLSQCTLQQNSILPQHTTDKSLLAALHANQKAQLVT